MKPLIIPGGKGAVEDGMVSPSGMLADAGWGDANAEEFPLVVESPPKSPREGCTGAD